jgi:hypothetical protein
MSESKRTWKDDLEPADWYLNQGYTWAGYTDEEPADPDSTMVHYTIPDRMQEDGYSHALHRVYRPPTPAEQFDEDEDVSVDHARALRRAGWLDEGFSEEERQVSIPKERREVKTTMHNLMQALQRSRAILEDAEYDDGRRQRGLTFDDVYEEVEEELTEGELEWIEAQKHG